MDLLVGGDSFTFHGEQDYSWARYLVENNSHIKNYKNVALGNAGNLYISRSVIDSVITMKNVDFVICGWSLELRGSGSDARKNVWWNDLPSYETAEMYTDIEMLELKQHNFRTLENIIRTQWFLESKGIDHKFFFAWKNNFASNVEFPLFNELNLDKFWYPDLRGKMALPQKHYQRFSKGENYKQLHKKWNGMLEWVACNVEDGLNQGYHPTVEAHKKFALEVASKWIS